ncbi:hypothetical protein Ais01nite_01400 [Asanoa ishikariensis]|uniref:N-acetyltransferase domain-containing protein n=1 Tax=Asanoa ishikariensis TaxID=137265 RepID=A0A1H3TN31_9ACTN|nr:GNAT family N-acetyltransferase [Asanoa ishikariensis]GIF62105.1 hypothetical protein Ais01nite_01400 [Asanoa ishikariensis]SDZ51616.1 hypothetical protein SAMN05421684_6082 [Asanoa ishikariensis]
MRRLRPGEVETVVKVFEGMSTWSRFLRYHTALPRLTGAYRRALTDVDGSRHVALVAERLDHRGWRPVGMSRLVTVRTQPTRVGEIAVEVVDAAHRQGFGEDLVRRIVAEAAVLGHDHVYAYVLRGNAPMRLLIDKLFPDATADGELITISTASRRVGG